MKTASLNIFVKNNHSLLTENPIGKAFTILSEVTSTNNYAMQQVQAHLAAHGETWFALHQNAGKGQRGKGWKDEPGKNILLSFVVEPHTISIDNQFLLTVAVSLGCFDFLTKYAIDQTSIKWPNDIYWRDRKAGGILIENLIQGKDWKYSIVGIGININQTFFSPDLPNPVSLKQITGKTFEAPELGVELCSIIERRWQQLQNKTQQPKLLREYESYLYKLHKKVSFKIEEAIVEAIVVGVNQSGQLLIDTGEVTPVNFGSVEWLLSQTNSTPDKI